MNSARWWLFSVILANISSVFLLIRLFKAEGKRYWDILHFSKATAGKDVLWLLGSSVIGVPVMAAPMNTLAAFIFGDSLTPINLMFRPSAGLGAGGRFSLSFDNRLCQITHLFRVCSAANSCSAKKWLAGL